MARYPSMSFSDAELIAEFKDRVVMASKIKDLEQKLNDYANTAFVQEGQIKELEQKLAESEKNLDLWKNSSYVMKDKMEAIKYVHEQDKSPTKFKEMKEKLSEALEVIRFYGEPENWQGPLGHERSDMITNDHDYIQHSRALDKCSVGGKRARDFLARHEIKGSENEKRD